MDAVKIKLNSREIDHIVEFREQIDNYLDRMEKYFLEGNREKMSILVAEFGILHFKIGERYVFRYHSGGSKE